MKELYTDLEVEVVVFESADIIKTSGNTVFGLDNNTPAKENTVSGNWWEN